MATVEASEIEHKIMVKGFTVTLSVLEAEVLHAVCRRIGGNNMERHVFHDRK